MTKKKVKLHEGWGTDDVTGYSNGYTLWTRTQSGQPGEPRYWLYKTPDAVRGRDDRVIAAAIRDQAPVAKFGSAQEAFIAMKKLAQRSVSEGFADEFVKFAQERGGKIRTGSQPTKPASVPAVHSAEPIDRAALEQELKQLSAQLDPNFEYSDDYSFWSKQRAIADRIAGIKQKLRVAEGVNIVDQDSDLDQQVFTLNVDGETVSFTYWDYENNFQNPDIKDIYQQARDQLGKKLSPEQIKAVARSVFKSFKSGVAEGSLEEYGNTAKGQKMLTKVQKRAVDRVVSKKADTDPAYAKKNKATADRAWERMTNLDEQGVAEGALDPSGLIAAASMVRDYIITAEVDGAVKKFRVRGMTGPGAAKERFLKHANQAKVLDVQEEGVKEAVKFVHGADPAGHTFSVGAVRHDLSNIKSQDAAIDPDRPVADIDPEWEFEQRLRQMIRDIASSSAAPEHKTAAINALIKQHGKSK